MTDTAVSVGPAAGLDPWSELDRLKLSYYSTRRDRRGGWMQLDLAPRPGEARIDSRIEASTELVWRSAKAAETRGLALDAATRPISRPSGSSCGPPNRFGAPRKAR